MNTLMKSPSPIRLLLLEDNPDDAELMLRELHKGGLAVTEKRVEARDEFVRSLAEFEPDVVITDYHLPSFDGRAALEIVRATRPDIPVIVVSGALNDEESSELMRLGAADFVLKDRPARLGAAVRNALQRAAEARLRRAEDARFRALIENLSEVIATLDAQGLVRYVSPSVTAIGGYAPGELVGRQFMDLLHPDDLEAERRAWRGVLESRGDFVVSERRIRIKDGTWRPCEMVASNLLHVPEVAGVVLVLRDITERKAAEEAMRQRAAEQEHFLRLTVGRELRMVELKDEVNAMALLAGRPPVYHRAGGASPAVAEAMRE